MSQLSRVLAAIAISLVSSTALANEIKSTVSIDQAIAYAIHKNPTVLRYLMKESPDAVKEYIRQNPNQARALAREYYGLIAVNTESPHSLDVMSDLPQEQNQQPQKWRSPQEFSQIKPEAGPSYELAAIPMDHPYGVMQHNDSVSISDAPKDAFEKKPHDAVSNKAQQKQQIKNARVKKTPKSFEDAKKATQSTVAKANPAQQQINTKNVATVASTQSNINQPVKNQLKQAQASKIPQTKIAKAHLVQSKPIEQAAAVVTAKPSPIKHKIAKTVAGNKRPLQSEVIPTSAPIEAPITSTPSSAEETKKHKNWAKH